MTSKILVVDDERLFELFIRKIFSQQIEADEYSFLFARNGNQALEMLENHEDILMVLSDINMPEMDGLTLLTILDERFPLISAVVVSAFGDVTNIRKSMNLGAFDFLIKPIDIEDLRKTVAKTLGHARQMRQLEEVHKEKELAQRQLVGHLQKMDKLKDEFLASISHELHTPLNGIIGIAESLVDGVSGDLPEVTRDNLSLIISSGKRLTSLVHDILDFSKLKNSDLTLDPHPVDLNSVIQVVLTLTRPLIAAKDINLESRVDADLPPVLADENRLQQVLHNLIGNAVKFTHKGTVVVEARARGDMIAVTVADTGIGIPQHRLREIFSPFTQLDNSTSRQYGGAGLGLAISEKLVHLQGGTIEVESQYSKGSRFTFSLPASDLPAGYPQDIEQVNRLIWSTEGARVPLPEQDEGKGSPRAFKVLVVDDEPVNLRVMANQFALENYAVVTATNGSDALEKIAEDPDFDLVLLDVMMPGMSGFEVCRKLRETYSMLRLPILIITARSNSRDFLEGLAAGANDYLAKPFDKREMLARAKTLLSLKQAVQDAIGHTRRLETEKLKRGLADNLRKITETLTSTLDLKEVLGRFLESLEGVASFRLALICLMRKGKLKAAITEGFQSLEGPEFAALKKGGDYLFKVMEETNLPIAVKAIGEDRHLVRIFPETDWQHSLLAVPFFHNGCVNGLVLLEKEGPPFDEQETQLVFAFAGQAAIAIENARLFERVQTMAKTEELTGLYNRRHFFVLAREAFQNAVVHSHALTAIMMDVDHFKMLNDTYGHSVGDEVLKEIASRITIACRKTDILGRYGGEEFVVLLPQTGLDVAREVSKRLRQGLKKKFITSGGHALSVTASLGIATLVPELKSLGELLKQADLAMYAAKQAGRDRIMTVAEAGTMGASGPSAN